MRRRVIAGTGKCTKRSRTPARFSPPSSRSLPTQNTVTSSSPRLHRDLDRVEAAKGSSVAIAGQNVSWSKKVPTPAKFPPLCLLKAGCRYSSLPLRAPPAFS